MIDTGDFITVREAAQLTGYTAEYLRRLARGKRIIHQKVGTIVLISKTDLERHKNEQIAKRQEPTIPPELLDPK